MNDQLTTDLYRSPTLEHLERLGERLPGITVKCVDCPKGVWFWAGKDDLTCFCSVMHEIKWRLAMDPILACDAREHAIAELIVALKPDQCS